ncbi:PREDICTED: molybdopterin synthase catalytic subunit isoform X2 [Miniopterus natalensis]|uniref:molybdopterin synthase catalytic subunit isoform X2 n=1 Tax=Miniopterus natalensis TaxID=291302 RepID=UPI0007A6D0BF|nr:PREDICTED: molybdopterin synthase catalytic subunit isoform X2 [Miniopterus natalensis]
MSSLEISSSCFSRGTKLPSSPPLAEGSAVEPLECVRGGNEVEEKPKDIIKFTAEKLSVGEVSQLVTSPLCGAVSLFVGTTRNNFEGKKVISLEYEAYIPMAENEVRRICSDVRQRWPVKHVAVFHRLGLVPVSEASVVIAVSSAHRAASLEAVSYAIDALKARVPIWKKEMYEESPSSWKRNKECFWATASD